MTNHVVQQNLREKLNTTANHMFDSAQEKAVKGSD